MTRAEKACDGALDSGWYGSTLMPRSGCGRFQLMSRPMTSVQNKLPSQYRARAQEARERAATTGDEETRKRLLNDAQLWERMAEFEEKTHPSSSN